MKALIISAFVSILAIDATAQDIRSAHLTWTVDQLLDTQTQDTVTYTCTFATQGSAAVVWSQRNGTYVTTLPVQTLTGEWSNISVPGQVVYTITLEGESGTLTVGRDAAGLFIKLDVISSESWALHHRYFVQTVTQN